VWVPDDARRVLDECSRGGTTLAEFARRHGYSAKRLYWWRRRLATEPAELTALSLVPATVTDRAVAAAAAITIRLPNGIGIEAPGATPAWIAAVVAELGRAS
jgi:transposase-like protein